jgi:hypothetical protein
MFRELMDRPSFGLAVLAATASLAMACSSAYADTADTPSDSGTATTPQIQQDDSTSTPSGSVSPDEGAPAGDKPSPPAEELGDDGAQEVGSSEETEQTFSGSTGGDPTVPPAGNPPETAPPAPAPQNSGDAAPKQEIDETPAAPSRPPAAAASPVTPSAPSSAPPTGETPAPGTTAPVAPTAPTRTGPVAQAGSTPAPTQAAGRLNQLLTEVGRELRTAEGQIDGLRRGLDRGAPPPPSHMTRLRATLVRITPMLAALEVRLDAAGRLSPRLRRLLHRVRSDLRGVRASAAGLVVALRQSGARGHELRLLLRELEAFRAPGATLASMPGVNPAPSAPATGPAHPQLQPAPVNSPVPAESAPPNPRAGGHRESPSRGVGGLSAESPSSSVPGSATASSGGSSSTAAAVALTMVLIGLALPALLARLDLPPGRRYSVALIAPLERPG